MTPAVQAHLLAGRSRLGQPAHGLGLAPEKVNAIHAEIGIGPLYG